MPAVPLRGYGKNTRNLQCITVSNEYKAVAAAWKKTLIFLVCLDIPGGL